MQKVTVSDIKIKEGMKGDRAWKLIIITGEDGSEFTTFDPKAAEVGVGGVIELEPVAKAGKINFTEFKILQKGPPSGGGSESRNGMTPELWAEKDRLERHSMESMSAFRGILELAATEQFNKLRSGSDATKDKLDKVFDKALDWALGHFKSTVVPAAKPATTQATKQEDKPDLQGLVFADAGKFKTACVEHIKMSLSQIDKETAGFDLNTEEGRKDAWASILVAYEKDPDNLFGKT